MKARVKNSNIINASETELLFSLSKEKSTHIIKKDEIIYAQNTEPLGVYLILSGNVRFIKKKSGKKTTLGDASKGDCFGLDSLMMNKKNICSAIATQNTVIRFIPANEFLTLASKFQEVAQKLLVRQCNLLETKE